MGRSARIQRIKSTGSWASAIGSVSSFRGEHRNGQPAAVKFVPVSSRLAAPLFLRPRGE
jgi:hypothetical protein